MEHTLKQTGLILGPSAPATSDICEDKSQQWNIHFDEVQVYKEITDGMTNDMESNHL